MAACVAALSACAAPSPDTVLLNGRIFTADPDQPWAEALAIRGDRITAVGSTPAVAALAGDGTRRRDLGGRTVIPGIGDAHVEMGETGPGPLRAWAAVAIARGVTSAHLLSMDRPVSGTVADLIAADTPLRVRVFRAPRPGPGGETLDSRPHLPPQPTFRIDVRGMAFAFGGGDRAGIDQAVRWAYGSEDLLAIEPLDAQAAEAYVEAIDRTGHADVWTRKRPRVERLPLWDAALGARLARAGVVVVQRPDGDLPLASVLRSGVPLALGTGGGVSPFAVLRWAVSSDRGADALSVEEAVMALTRGSAYAELTERDKGRLTAGALADLAVLSDDVFTAPPERLDAIRSTLTMIGGRPVHDVP